MVRQIVVHRARRDGPRPDQGERRKHIRAVERGDLGDHPADADPTEVRRPDAKRPDQRRGVGNEIPQVYAGAWAEGGRRAAVPQVVADNVTPARASPSHSASGQENIVVPPASRTSGAAASPKRSTPSVTPLASTVVMRPAPLRRSRSRRASRTGPRSVPSCRSFPRVHPLRATAEFVYSAHNHRARIWLARGFHNGDSVGAVRGTRGRRSASPETVTGPMETPASCRSVAKASFANGGFVARTRFGVFGQAMSAMGPGHYGEVSS